jgi:hypothetical protein
VIRNTNLNNGAPNGVRVLAEFDVLDAGQYWWLYNKLK